MSDSRAQTGVRSLLARFENNNNNNASTSPPSRGRSPIDHDRPSSVRPLSKVRASFVAVERTGQSGSAPMWGLRKASDLDSNNTNNSNGSNGSTNNSPGKLTRTMSGGVDDVGSPLERSVTMSSNDSADKGPMLGRSLASSPPDHNNINTNNASRNNDAHLGSGNINRTWAAKLPTRLTDSPTPGKQSTSGDTLMAASVATEGKPESRKIESKGGSQEDRPQVKDIAPIAATRMNGKSTDKTANKKLKSSMNPSIRPANIVVGNDANATSKKSSTKDQKSPLPRTPRTPTTVNPSAKPTPKETDRPRATTTKQPVRAAAGKTTTKPQSSVPTRDKVTKPPSENPPNNNRPRTRSPTRPVRLPNSMIAPTASSAAKLNLDGRPASQAGTRTSNLTRKPSSLRSDRNTASSRATGPAATSTAQKQSTRASSLAPQQNTAHERPRSRVSNIGGTRPADESFLARMMRPTASSASKMHEKIEIKSPPRGSRPPKARRKSGESTSSHVSMTASTPPSSKKSVVKPSQALSSNGDVEPSKHPEPYGAQAQVQAQTEVTATAAAEVEIATQEPEPEPALESEAEAEPEQPTIAEPEPAAAEPVTEPEPAHSEAAFIETATAEPAAPVHLSEPEHEPEPVVSEPIAPNPATTELSLAPLPEITEVSIVEEDPTKAPLTEGTEQVEL
ncbi:hypothetical protein AJ78_03593 [Emergomyces pasteurianus Ep9510]|uniref:Uncharacterized protein n=1 Tax=Emergomyces pasteurianus Ep9510 TaxID=1447872 RepID=A0A1J9QLY4_9EURO|nr:hypothetical protein AJ78_03593 [Emergomyces pasteurianus Ep9510]